MFTALDCGDGVAHDFLLEANKVKRELMPIVVSLDWWFGLVTNVAIFIDLSVFVLYSIPHSRHYAHS
jgi:hypothetical protein